MARRHRYNDDPDIVHVPLAQDEAQWVAEHPGSIRSKSDVTHFAQRAAATAAQVARMRVDFDNELRRRTAATGPSRGAPATMSPEQAARFLAPEQLAKLFDRLSQDKLATLDALKQTAQEKADAADALQNQLLTILSELASDASLPDHLRERSNSLIQQVRTERPNP